MRISDWSSDVCSSDLLKRAPVVESLVQNPAVMRLVHAILEPWCDTVQLNLTQALELHPGAPAQFPHRDQDMWRGPTGELEYLVNVMWPISPFRSEEHKSELQSLMRISYAVF